MSLTGSGLLYHNYWRLAARWTTVETFRRNVSTDFIIIEVLDQSPSLIKARLYIAPALFVQVYRNDSFDTTNLVLIHNRARLYARDQLGGQWRRHTAIAPSQHDTTPDGRQSATLTKFPDEVEAVLASLGLP